MSEQLPGSKRTGTRQISAPSTDKKRKQGDCTPFPQRRCYSLNSCRINKLPPWSAQVPTAGREGGRAVNFKGVIRSIQRCCVSPLQQTQPQLHGFVQPCHINLLRSITTHRHTCLQWSLCASQILMTGRRKLQRSLIQPQFHLTHTMRVTAMQSPPVWPGTNISPATIVPKSQCEVFLHPRSNSFQSTA